MVHFTYRPDLTKEKQMKMFAQKFGLHDSLLETNLMKGYELYASQLHLMGG